MCLFCGDYDWSCIDLIPDHCQEVPVLVLRKGSCHAVRDIVSSRCLMSLSIRYFVQPISLDHLLERAKIRPKLEVRVPLSV